MMNHEDEIGLYFRGFFLENNSDVIKLKDLGINFKLLDLSSKNPVKVYRGIKTSNEPPTSNIKKIKSDFDNNGNPSNYRYPVYLFVFRHQESEYIFCCLPNVRLFSYIFSSANYSYFKFDLKNICSSFFMLNDSPNITLTRLNGKLNYDKSDSVTAISLYGKNNLQSNVIRKFLQLYPESSHTENPFEENPPLIEPKSCRISYNDNIRAFGLNIDSAGNFSFYLFDNLQFLYFYEILKFAIDSNAFIQADVSPLKRSVLSLEKVE